jgi:hypothetical protein
MNDPGDGVRKLSVVKISPSSCCVEKLGAKSNREKRYQGTSASEEWEINRRGYRRSRWWQESGGVIRSVTEGFCMMYEMLSFSSDTSISPQQIHKGAEASWQARQENSNTTNARSTE